MSKSKSRSKRADYVPEPRPATSDYLVGVHYFPGWKQGTHYGWQRIQDYPERTPLLGYYDEDDPEVMDWQIKWALEHGISYFIYCWYREPKNVGHPVTMENVYLSHAIHDGLFHARYQDMFKFTIMWENNVSGVASEDDLLRNLLPFWIENYFKRPNYLKIDNKPVLFIYSLDWPNHSLKKDFGSIESIRAALDKMRNVCRKAGFDDLILLCEFRGPEINVLQDINDCGFDYAFAYCWPTPQQYPTAEEAIEAQLARMKAWRDADVVPFVATASVGWDPKAWTAPERWDQISRWKLRPDEFKRLLVKVKAFVDEMPEGALSRRMILLDNWNEWGEGHYIAPHADGGFGYLQAARDVLSNADNEPDYRLPQDLGLGPYDSLWRNSPDAQRTGV